MVMVVDLSRILLHFGHFSAYLSHPYHQTLTAHFYFQTEEKVRGLVIAVIEINLMLFFTDGKISCISELILNCQP